jgi:hypothetical protein
MGIKNIYVYFPERGEASSHVKRRSHSQGVVCGEMDTKRVVLNKNERVTKEREIERIL